MLTKGKDSGWLVAASILLLLGIQVAQFSVGFRLTADDAMFLQYAWQGWDHVWNEATRVAQFSGRIGHHIMTPLNVLGSLWAGNPLTRGLMVLAHFGVMAVFARYFSTLVARGSWRVTALLMVTFLALNPLAFEHMPPNAYPLQNTVPFLIVLLSRILLWRTPNRAASIQIMLYLLMAIAMLVSEFVFLLTTALLAAEHLANAAYPQPRSSQRRIIGVPVRVGVLTKDLLLVCLTLAIYLGYRFHFPSQYEGNTPSGLSEPYRFWLTSLYHVYAGTAFFRLPDVALSEISIRTWLVAAAVGLVTASCTAWLLRRLPLRSSYAALAILLIACSLMLYIAFPLASTARQQLWCLELGTCGYLDSRVSYLGIGAVAYAVSVLLLKAVDGSQVLRRGLTVLLAMSVGTVAGINHAANTLVAKEMSRHAEPWQKAHELACSSGIANPLSTQKMVAIDPNQTIAMHAGTNRRIFWLQYMNDRRAAGACETGQTQGLLSPLIDRAYTSLGADAPVPNGTLVNGWSHRESWGVWSDGDSSTIRVPPAPPRARTLRLRFQLFWGPSVNQQIIKVYLNNTLYDRWPMVANQKDCCVRDIAVPVNLPLTGPDRPEIRLEYSHTRIPGFPGESDDVRHLALGLHSLEWIEEEP